ncbi:syndecan-2-B [Astyanax mexicanus]|uniref:syndecan-2-B n=1 Tax=Astyanax mexicanus TaxID=7994 RepID=UPI0020CAEE3D|nr:syndecan-2-B [Astyanax mexicanus]
MRNVWMLITLWALCFWGEGVLVSGQPSTADDIYLEEQQSGDYPVDDDDYNSGSGSGFSEDDEDRVSVRKENMNPVETFTQTSSPSLETPSHIDYSSAVDTTEDYQTDTEVFDYQTEGTQGIDVPTSTSSSPSLSQESEKHHEGKKTSETLFQRTEVLAAVIAGGVIGFLFAIFLILILVYRMRKKDEGSYDLGERKPPSTAYQKAPTKEFYA